GLWQVSGRNSLGFQEMVNLDLHYIRERSMFLDIKIIFKTVFVLFGSKNAY
ncbi:sugar transferase, partial [Streptococcus hyovaginalis]